MGFATQWGHTRRIVARQAAPCCDDSSANSDDPRKAAASSAIWNNLSELSSIAQRHASLKKIASFRPEP
jgi:hypothetical protein